ncbi:DoxX family membrane protein [Roseococcus sp. SDR]|uniref:DoxX family protein n=1 Tax=Roseococcus sp. SDR TaxID=2835532 RepID=UPI001BD1B28A|nr:DoxX family membrane protein [Roseococcus sp. SDR]MBS7788699.1 DoxX family membrane protein [Roseococcus sp. SDR]MBV1844013.1 DoxX family membrane protein [Roseococcus sp. SDR]
MPEARLAIALLVLRLTLGVFFLQWGIEKFVVPATTLAIFRNFYGIDFGSWVPPILGVAQVLIAVALLLGFQPRLTYGIVLLLHGVTVIVSIPRILSPWNPVSNHFFIAGVPILAAFFALYLLRDWDRYRIGGAGKVSPAA